MSQICPNSRVVRKGTIMSSLTILNTLLSNNVTLPTPLLHKPMPKVSPYVNVCKLA